MTFLWLKCSRESNKKSPPAPEYSQTINDSKKNGLFQFEVVADKPNLMLVGGLKFEIKEAWVENEWSVQNCVFGTPTKTRFTTYFLPPGKNSVTQVTPYPFNFDFDAYYAQPTVKLSAAQAIVISQIVMQKYIADFQNSGYES